MSLKKMITYLIMVMYCLLMYSSDALYNKPLVTIVAKGLVGTDPQLERIIGNEQGSIQSSYGNM